MIQLCSCTCPALSIVSALECVCVCVCVCCTALCPWWLGVETRFWSEIYYYYDQIHELCSQLIQAEREIVFLWVPAHVDMRGNSAADSATKDALDGEIIPFFDLKPRLNNDNFELWQREWDEYPQNRLHKILTTLPGRLPSCCLTRREDTALSLPLACVLVNLI